jgi:hypothetical protein
LAGKLFQKYNRLFGIDYLEGTLGPIIRNVIDENVSFETGIV